MSLLTEKDGRGDISHCPYTAFIHGSGSIRSYEKPITGFMYAGLEIN